MQTAPLPSTHLAMPFSGAPLAGPPLAVGHPSTALAAPFAALPFAVPPLAGTSPVPAPFAAAAIAAAKPPPPVPAAVDGGTPAAPVSGPATGPTRNLFVVGLPADANDAELRAAFAAHGPVQSAKVMLDVRTGRSRGFGFVLFRELTDAACACAALGDRPLPRQAGGAPGPVLRVSFSAHDAAHLSLDVPTIHVRNVPNSVTAAALSGFLDATLRSSADAATQEDAPAASAGSLTPSESSTIPAATSPAGSDVSVEAAKWAGGVVRSMHFRVCRLPGAAAYVRTAVVEFASPALARSAVELLHGSRPLPAQKADPALPPLLAKLEEPSAVRQQRLAQHRESRPAPAPAALKAPEPMPHAPVISLPPMLLAPAQVLAAPPLIPVAQAPPPVAGLESLQLSIAPIAFDPRLPIPGSQFAPSLAPAPLMAVAPLMAGDPLMAAAFPPM